MGVPQYFSVREGVASLSLLGNVTVGNEMAVSIIDKQIPTASLLHHLDSALTCNTTAKSVYLFILVEKLFPLSQCHTARSYLSIVTCMGILELL